MTKRRNLLREAYLKGYRKAIKESQVGNSAERLRQVIHDTLSKAVVSDREAGWNWANDYVQLLEKIVDLKEDFVSNGASVKGVTPTAAKNAIALGVEDFLDEEEELTTHACDNRDEEDYVIEQSAKELYRFIKQYGGKW